MNMELNAGLDLSEYISCAIVEIGLSLNSEYL